ncbi:MAG: helix-hairpin-helix domain-containing protein [Thermoplasmata archaeon]|nr:MAG: helix-hairpin-helix domain-containing protein [Thermoplasmata archaeon]
MKKDMKGIILMVIGLNIAAYGGSIVIPILMMPSDVSEIAYGGFGTLFFLGGLAGSIIGLVMFFMGWKLYSEASLESKARKGEYWQPPLSSHQPVIVQSYREEEAGYPRTDVRKTEPVRKTVPTAEVVEEQKPKVEKKAEPKVPQKSRGAMIREYEAIFNISEDRARNLYDSGYTTARALALAELSDLLKVEGINPTIAKKIKRTARILERIRD